MATTLADAWIRVRPRTDQFGKELKDEARKHGGDAGDEAGKSFASRMRSTLAGLAAGIIGGVVTRKIVDTLREGVGLASDLSETISKTNVIFGAQAGNIQKWANNANTSLGQTKQQALDGASQFALYGKQAGFAGNQLANFSIHLVGMAADMASFSNTSPEEAIQAIGAAFRGESDPIEKYGVLLNEARLKQVALEKGIIKTTSGALTPQQRVLAVQAALYQQLGEKGSGTLGDFERTSAGLANQQRILVAQWQDMKATIGAALLPIVTQFATTLNAQVMPALMDLWQKHGPKVTEFLTHVADRFAVWAANLKNVDLSTVLDRGREAVEKLGPALRDIKDNAGPQFVDTLKVGGVVVGFLADHLDTLAKWLPLIVAGFIAVKTAQATANLVMAAGIPLRVAEAIGATRMRGALRAHTAALIENTAVQRAATGAQVAEAGATNLGTLARARAIVTMAAHRAATIASTVVTWLWTAATTALGVAVRFALGPVGLIIAAIALLVAGIVYAYRHNETFRRIVQATWRAIQIAAKAVVDWFVGTLWPLLQKVWNGIVAGVKFAVELYIGYLNLVRAVAFAVWGFVADYVRDRVNAVIAVVRGIIAVYHFIRDAMTLAHAIVVERINQVVDFIRGLPGRARDAVGNLGNLLVQAGKDLVLGLWNGIQSLGGWLAGKVSGFINDHVPGPVKRLLGIASPSRLFHRFGQDTVRGYLQGVQSMTDSVADLGHRFRFGAPPPPAAAMAGGLASVTVLADFGRGVREVVESTIVDNPDMVAKANTAGTRRNNRRGVAK